MDGLDRVLENLLPASTSVRRFLEGPETPVSVDLDELASLPQSMGESWQADVRRLPGWLEQGGELRRPWASLVTSRDEHTVLTQNLTMDPPPDAWIWKNVVDAIHRPLMGEPHRPGIVEVGSDAFQRVLHDRLEAIGVRCVAADDLEQIDEIFRQLGKFLSGGKASPPLVDVPGVQLDDIRGFYAAAADFYRAAPWRLVPGDTTLKIECPKFNTHTWYGVVMGQSGLVLGLALYEDLGMLQRLFTGSGSDEEMSRQATGLSVMYGEAFEIPIADLDAAERHGWPVVGPEAYPNPIYVNPGRSMRPPLAWELELLEGCLRAIPQFLESGAASATIKVHGLAGRLDVAVVADGRTVISAWKTCSPPVDSNRRSRSGYRHRNGTAPAAQPVIDLTSTGSRHAINGFSTPHIRPILLRKPLHHKPFTSIARFAADKFFWLITTTAIYKE